MGFLLGTIGITIVDAICQIITYLSELTKASLNVKITQYNKIIHQIHEEEEIKAPVIGFHIPTEGDEDFENDEDY